MATTKKRLLTGDRPTGPLHLGHLAGSLLERVSLQNKYETFILVADLHVLTTKPAAGELDKRSIQLVRDNLSVGLDPQKTTFLLQSAIPAIAELAVILGMLTTVNRLQRIPTLKEQLTALAIKQPSFGLLGYPVLMSADILSFNAAVVPVGEDQLSHLELTRELVRRFNRTFKSVLTLPQAHLGVVPRLLGTDGQAKMSKSLNNGIALSDSPDEVRRKVMNMYTDPSRKRATDPGKVEGNPVFQYHDAFNKDHAAVTEMKRRYRAGQIGDVEVKEQLVKVLLPMLAPIQERQRQISDRQARQILTVGTKRAAAIAQTTLDSVKEALSFLSL